MSCCHDDFQRFRFSVRGSTVPIFILVGPNPTPLATLRIHANPNDVVWLTANIGWQVIANRAGSSEAIVEFKIFRGDHLTGTEIFRAIDSAQDAPNDEFVVTHLSHVDSGFTFDAKYDYTLTAELFNGNQGDLGVVQVIGPITFTALEIDID